MSEFRQADILRLQAELDKIKGRDAYLMARHYYEVLHYTYDDIAKIIGQTRQTVAKKYFSDNK